QEEDHLAERAPVVRARPILRARSPDVLADALPEYPSICGGDNPQERGVRPQGGTRTPNPPDNGPAQSVEGSLRQAEMGDRNRQVRGQVVDQMSRGRDFRTLVGEAELESFLDCQLKFQQLKSHSNLFP